MVHHLTIRIIGKVQGVFYRASASNRAEALGLKGFIQNEKDGSVYAEAEGTDEQLRDFLKWCRQGPPQSKVSEVIAISGELKHFEKFEIRR